LLLFDAALLVLLPHAVAVIACVAVAIFGVLIGSRLSWTTALLAIGYPLFDPIAAAFGTTAPVFFALRSLLVFAAVWMLLASVRRPASLFAAFVTDPIVFFALALGVIVALGMLITPSPVYGRQKVVAYFATNLPLLGAGYLLARRHDPEPPRRCDARFESFLLATGAIGLLMAVIGLLNAALEFYPYRSRLMILGLNPIWLARIMGITVIALLLLVDLGRIRMRTALLLVISPGIVLILTGSRGPFLSLLLILAMRAMIFTRISTARRAGLAVVGMVAGVLLFLGMPEEFRGRFLHPMGVDPSGAVRLRFFEVARSALAYVAGWGTGTGGFSDLLGKGDFRFYPHNLMVEIGIENGIPGLIAMVGLVVAALARGFRSHRNPYTLAALLGFLYAFVNAQFSGDLMANEWIWLFAGLLAGRTR
jgi:hypothetical protein